MADRTHADTQIAVLIACHNRCALTMAAIDAIYAAARRAGVIARVVLTDDNSTDGTSDAVATRHPLVRIVKGDGSLFWGGGMALAWRTALAEQQEGTFAADFFLWLNDDLAVHNDALINALAAYDANGEPRTIVVGRTVDPITGATTYGAYARASKLTRLRFRRPKTGERAVTMNGNFVLIPKCATDAIGIIDDKFRHGGGDNDYGLRASAAGWTIVETPQPVGEQAANTAWERRFTSMTLATALGVMNDPKGVPWRAWLRFTRRHAGPMWPANFVGKYVKMLIIGTLERR